ncbi:hypothetical protein [Saccharothrix deserti]|uniref:hypothetical protein n=1 Tax=Saccharothrix deserti TaxID=2593674 RepID=UPI00131AFBEB|nr:hypothetical protein [Saccharothrix deserti]
MSNQTTAHTSKATRPTWRRRVTACTGATLATTAALLAGPTAPAHAAVDGYIPSSYGNASFLSYGERLLACDTKADAHSVTARLYTDTMQLRASVKDVDGAQLGCGEINLEIAEGTPLWLTLCISDGLGCLPFQRVQA